MAAGVVAAGTGLEMYAARKASKANREALQAQALERERAAAEVMERFEVRAEMDRMQTKDLISQQKSAFTKGGIDLGTGTPLLAEEEAKRLSERAISLSEREAQFSSEQLLREASAERRAADDERKANRLRMASIVLKSGGQVAMAKMR